MAGLRRPGFGCGREHNSDHTRAVDLFAKHAHTDSILSSRRRNHQLPRVFALSLPDTGTLHHLYLAYPLESGLLRAKNAYSPRWLRTPHFASGVRTSPCHHAYRGSAMDASSWFRRPASATVNRDGDPRYFFRSPPTLWKSSCSAAFRFGFAVNIRRFFGSQTNATHGGAAKAVGTRESRLITSSSDSPVSTRLFAVRA